MEPPVRRVGGWFLMRRIVEGENAGSAAIAGSISGAVPVAGSPQFVVEVDDAFERPGRGLGLRRGGNAGAALQVGNEGLYVRAELLKMRGVCLQLLERLLMHQPQCMSFAIERLFERSDSMIDVRS
jgi:hypothetical protein